MMIKNVLQNNAAPCSFVVFVFVVTLAGISPLWAQTPGSVTGPAFVQRLSWTGDEYTLRYEVVVEREEDGAYQRVLREFTEELSLELFLPPGNYRCSVIPYDFLNRPGERSAWKSIEVRALVEPETSEEEIALVDPEASEEEIALVEPEASEEEIALVDTETSEEEIAIIEPVPSYPPAALFFSMAWMPMIPMYFVEESVFFGQSPSLLGAGARFSAISSRQSFLNFGMEWTASWYAFDTGLLEDQTSLQHVITVEFNMLAQKWLPRRITALTFRIGAGLSLLAGDQTTTTVSNQHCLYIDMGLSFLLLPGKHFYLEAGLDYIHLFTWDFPGSLRPWIGMGWRLKH